MADPTSEFFERLGQRRVPQLASVTATIRVDLNQGGTPEHWFLTVDRGNISISRENVEADASLHTDKEMFNQLARGEANPYVSFLRGRVHAEGDTETIVLFQGLFPAPHNERSRQAWADKER